MNLPFPNKKILHGESLQMKFSNLMKMAEKGSKRVENTVGKGEIAHHEQFLLFP